MSRVSHTLQSAMAQMSCLVTYLPRNHGLASFREGFLSPECHIVHHFWTPDLRGHFLSSASIYSVVIVVRHSAHLEMLDVTNFSTAENRCSKYRDTGVRRYFVTASVRNDFFKSEGRFIASLIGATFRAN